VRFGFFVSQSGALFGIGAETVTFPYKIYHLSTWFEKDFP